MKSSAPAFASAGLLFLVAIGLLVPELVLGADGSLGPRSVLLVTIDTARADRLAASGTGAGEGAISRTETMPRLAELARRGVLFRHAFSQTPLTVPSHATILTGLDPRHHGVRDNSGYALAPTIPTLAEVLSREGMRCAAFIGGAPLSHRPDMARGFELYDDRMTRAAGGGAGPLSERRAEEVVGAALSWLGRLDRKTRYFAWVHLYDPHDPYEAPGAARRAGESAYDGEVRYADAALGRLVGNLAAAGRMSGTLIVVVGDHGEMLGEHGEATHGIFLYQGALTVPLVIVLPGSGRGRATDRPTPLSDLVPTILDLVGASWPGASDGESAAAELLAAKASRGGGDERTSDGERPAPTAGSGVTAAKGQAPAGRGQAAGAARGMPEQAGRAGPRWGAASKPRTFYVETIHPRRRYGWSPLYGLVEWPMKFIDAPEPELYDLRADPGETKNLLKGVNAQPWRSRLARLRGVGAPARAEPVDEERLEALRSLGYVGSISGATPRGALEDRPRRDPKRGVAILPMLQAGLVALDASDGRGAARALDQALAVEPDSVLALHNRGIAAMMQGDPVDAARWFRKAAETDPWSDNVQADLGAALARQGRPLEAEAAYRRTLELNPDFLTARFNLAVLMLNAGRKDDARVELQKVRAANPDFPHLREALEALGEGGAQ